MGKPGVGITVVKSGKFSIKTYVVVTYMNRLCEAILIDSNDMILWRTDGNYAKKNSYYLVYCKGFMGTETST